MRISPFFIAIFYLPLAGCSTFGPKDVVSPSELTVENALRGIGKGFAEMKYELRQGDTKLGLFPCKVTVNLNVTASAETKDKLVIDTSSAPTSLSQQTTTRTLSASANFEHSNTAKAERGNAIAIEMTSIACIPNNTLATLHPDKLKIVTDAAVDGVERAPYFIRTATQQ